MQNVPERRPPPLVLALVLAVALLAPVGVAVATGLISGPAEDEVATTGDRATTTEATDDGARPAGVLRALEASSTTSASTATTSSTTSTTTTTTAPPTTTTTAPPPPPTTAPAPPPPPAPPPGGREDSLEAQVVQLANQARAANGCGPLAVDGHLAAAARAHSDDMAINDYFSHDSLDGRSFVDRARDAGYTGSPGGENIARGQDSAQGVHDAWMSSSGHRANILNCSFTEIGVGVNVDAWTWTQDFGS